MAAWKAWRWGSLLALVLLPIAFVACATTPEGATWQGVYSQTSTLRSVAAAPAAVRDRILYVGTDFSLYSVRPDGRLRRRLTPGTALYAWPGWSPEGRWIAFSWVAKPGQAEGPALAVTDARGRAVSRLFNNSLGTAPALGARVPYYASWSPDGSKLGFVAAAPDAASGLDLRVVQGSGSGQEPQRIGSGAPIYFAWSPDGNGVLVHTGPDLFQVDLGPGTPRLELGARSERYRAPAWSPKGDAIAFVAADGAGENLYVARQYGARRQSVMKVEGFAAFLWDPKGDRMAVGQSRDPKDPLLQEVRLVDIATGQSQRLVEAPVLAFFWSPDGRKLAYVTVSADGKALQWRVVELASGKDTPLADFRPSSDELLWLALFDQYATSHRVWSPDSRSLVFAGVLAGEADQLARDGASRVYVVGVRGDEPPRPVAQGVLGMWSPR